MMLPQFTATAASFGRATSLITRIGTDAHVYDDPDAENLLVLLDSKYEAEKVEGVKRLIALMSQGRDVSNFFPQVVKNVSTPSLELKKLVYFYLVQYAEKRPDEALLAMNTFQKDLSDLNPMVRAWALRAMSGIRVRVVLPLVVMAVNKGARDPSPYVRRCAALAISKIHALDHEQHGEALEELICFLMNDHSPGVIGAVAATFTAVCPEKLSLWGTRYRELCELLPSVDEWGQVVLIDILLRYAVGRHGYPDGSVGRLSLSVDDNVKQEALLNGKVKEKMDDESLPVSMNGSGTTKFWKDGGGSSVSADKRTSGSRIPTDFWNSKAFDAGNIESSRDISILLQSTASLLQSNNCAVVMAAAGVHWLLASMEDLKKTVRPLLFLLRSSFESQYVVLANITTFVKRAPSLFEDYYEEFFVSTADVEQIRAMKLDILCQIATESSIHVILREFQDYVRDPDFQFAAKTVRAIGQCAFRLQSVAKVCTEALLTLARTGSEPELRGDADDGDVEDAESPKLKVSRRVGSRAKKGQSSSGRTDREALVVLEAVTALRTIVHGDPAANEEVLTRLACELDRLRVSAARTIVIWMIGEFGTVGHQFPEMVPVILQYLGGSFKEEEDEVKLQILNCAAKVVLRDKTSKSSSSKASVVILDYLLSLSAVDLNYDLRDRSRLYRGLLSASLEGFQRPVNDESENDLPKAVLDLNFEERRPTLQVDTRRSDQTTFQKTSKEADGDAMNLEKKVKLLNFAKHVFLVTKPPPVPSSLAPDRSAFLAGTMSHVVLHRAPNYLPLPNPMSIEDAIPPNNSPSVSPSPRSLHDQRVEITDSELSSNSNDEYSGNLSEDGVSDGSSNQRDRGGFYDEASDEDRLQNSQANIRSSERHSSGPKLPREKPSSKPGHRQEIGPLINLSDSDGEPLHRRHHPVAQQPLDGNASSDFGLLSAAELDSWLESSESTREGAVSASETLSGYATVYVGPLDVHPRTYPILDFTNGAGLDVKYSFDRVSSESNKNLLNLVLYFENRSTESLSNIIVMDAQPGDTYHEIGKTPESSVAGANSELASEQRVAELDSGCLADRRLPVHFRDHLKWIRLTILCSEKTFPVKFIPTAGALIRPFLLKPDEFFAAESKLTGMYEAVRRCQLITPSARDGTSAGEDWILSISRSIALRVLSIANLSFISTIMPIVDSELGEQAMKDDGLQGLCLLFSGETVTGSVPCLVKVTVLTQKILSRDGARVEIAVKINCEDTVYGLNLLQELSKAFDPSD